MYAGKRVEEVTKGSRGPGTRSTRYTWGLLGRFLVSGAACAAGSRRSRARRVACFFRRRRACRFAPRCRTGSSAARPGPASRAGISGKTDLTRAPDSRGLRRSLRRGLWHGARARGSTGARQGSGVAVCRAGRAGVAVGGAKSASALSDPPQCGGARTSCTPSTASRLGPWARREVRSASSGESGCGKSTSARCGARFHEPTTAGPVPQRRPSQAARTGVAAVPARDAR